MLLSTFATVNHTFSPILSVFLTFSPIFAASADILSCLMIAIVILRLIIWWLWIRTSEGWSSCQKIKSSLVRILEAFFMCSESFHNLCCRYLMNLLFVFVSYECGFRSLWTHLIACRLYFDSFVFVKLGKKRMRK
jgi:hypothetical protein